MTSLTPAQLFTQYLGSCVWLGNGRVFFPTMPQTIDFGCLLKAEAPKVQTKSFFMQTSLESWKAGMRGKMGMHYESGFLRITGDTQLEWCLAHNFGVTEVCKGTVTHDGTRAIFESTQLGNAALVKSTKRSMTFILNGEHHPVKLSDVMSMATPDVPDVTEHLAIEYEPEHHTKAAAASS